ncbi:MAG: SLBB domain-containing protein [Pyrinomonadaceae bacterium]
MSRYRPFLSFIFLITAAVCVAGQGTNAATARDVMERIHVGDIVDVDVLGSFDYDWRGGLNPEGFLDNFNKVATPVFALCRTPDELAGVIEREYGVFLRTPDVRVRIVDRSNRPVAYVHGAVKNPHRFRLLRPASLIELLVYSGGITDRSRGEVTIFRNPALNCTRPTERGEGSSAPDPRLISIKIADLLAGSPDANFILLGGDIVQVSESLPVYVLGEVAAPRRMNLTPGLNLARAVTAAGGIVGSYRGQKVRLYRRGGDGKMMEFDWKTASEQDIKLEPYDVIEVERRGSGPARIPTLPGPDELSREELEKLPLRVVD